MTSREGSFLFCTVAFPTLRQHLRFTFQFQAKNMNIACWLWLLPAGALFGFVALWIAGAGLPDRSRGTSEQGESGVSILTGMTPAVEQALYNCGILTLEQMASIKPTRLRCILKRKKITVADDVINAWPRESHSLSSRRRNEAQDVHTVNGRSKNSSKSEPPFRDRFSRAALLLFVVFALTALLLFLFRSPLGCAAGGTAHSQPCPNSGVTSCPIVPPCPPIKAVLINSDALFEFDRSELKPEGGELLMTQLMDATKQRDPKKIQVTSITGHTDLFGTDGYNLDLSEKRAQTIQNTLEKFGVSSAASAKRAGNGMRTPLTDVERICYEHYPKSADADPANIANRKACFQPLRRVELTIDGSSQ
jgi:outer membrane protein OmpA-like peptidoglycan-associated protein